MKKIRKSPYYYSSGQWLAMEYNAKRKYARALVYDFLRKNFLCQTAYDIFTICHNAREKNEIMSFKDFLDYTIDQLIGLNISLRNYFYDERIFFHWTRQNGWVHQEMQEIDRKWLKLIDNEIGK